MRSSFLASAAGGALGGVLQDQTRITREAASQLWSRRPDADRDVIFEMNPVTGVPIQLLDTEAALGYRVVPALNSSGELIGVAAPRNSHGGYDMEAKLLLISRFPSATVPQQPLANVSGTLPASSIRGRDLLGIVAQLAGSTRIRFKPDAKRLGSASGQRYASYQPFTTLAQLQETAEPAWLNLDIAHDFAAGIMRVEGLGGAGSWGADPTGEAHAFPASSASATGPRATTATSDDGRGAVERDAG